MLLLLVACTCAGPALEPQVVEPGPPTMREVTTRFADQPVAELAPERAFAIAARCPRITSITYTPENPSYARVELRGEHLDRVKKVGGALPDGTLVDLRFQSTADGIGFPILAPDVEFVLGTVDAGVTVGCRGPGYSFSVEKGKVVGG